MDEPEGMLGTCRNLRSKHINVNLEAYRFVPRDGSFRYQ